MKEDLQVKFLDMGIAEWKKLANIFNSKAETSNFRAQRRVNQATQCVVQGLVPVSAMTLCRYRGVRKLREIIHFCDFQVHEHFSK